MFQSNQGAICTDCTKLFLKPATASPQPSSVAGARRAPKALTNAQLQQVRKAAWKKRSALLERSKQPAGIQIRGRWTSTGELQLWNVTES